MKVEFIEELICLKALSLVQKHALVEDLYLYALAAGGQAGVERALEKYKSELS